MRVLPNVHAALRQNDPSMVTGSQPVLKKARPSTPEAADATPPDKEPPSWYNATLQPPPPSTARHGYVPSH